jgi:integrase
MVIVVLTLWCVYLIVGDSDFVSLVNKTKDTVLQGYAPRTWTGYETDWRYYLQFCESFGFAPLPPDELVLALFMNWSTRSRQYSAIARSISALKVYFRDSGYSYPENSLLLQLTDRGLERMAPPPKKKQPLRLHHLLGVRAVLTSTPADCRNYLILVLSFFGLLRISEVMKLLWSDLTWESDIVWMRIAPSKKQKEVEFVPLCANVNVEVCPTVVLKAWQAWSIKASLYSIEGAIFRHANKFKVNIGVLGIAQARVVCKQLLTRAGFDASQLVTHGARRGGYQLCESLNISEADAGHMGRWMNIDTARHYSGGHLAARLRVARAMSGAL